MSITAHLLMRATHKILDWLEAAWHDTRSHKGRRQRPPSGEREPRCGPWVDRGNGTSECTKCGEISGPYGGGPFGF